MKTIVIHIKDDICAKNGRDPEATSLIEAARSFGTVESWDTAVASLRAEYQAVINNLKLDLDKISENEVTPDELEVLKIIRKKSSKEAVEYQKAIADRDAQLQAVKVENENRAAQIRNIFGL